MYVIGLDPGLSGGVAFLPLGEDRPPACFALPVREHFSGKGTEIDVCCLDALLTAEATRLGGQPSLCVIERVGALRRGAQARPQGVASAFNFGDGFGRVRTLFELRHWNLVYPRPQEWQRRVLSGMSGGDTKKQALSFASRRFAGVNLLATPKCRVPHPGMVDALCLAEFARRQLSLPE